MSKGLSHGNRLRFESCHPDQNQSLANSKFVRLSNLKNNTGVTSGVSTLYKPERVMALPYTLPRLVIPAKASKDQRWVIKFRVWNADIEKVVLMRDYTCNSKKDITERKETAKRIIEQISAALRDGKHIDTPKRLAQEEAKKVQTAHTLKDALNVAMFWKRAENIKSIRNYENCYRRLCDWIAKAEYNQLPIEAVNHNHVELFLNSLSKDNPLSNRAYNNYRDQVSTLFQVLLQKDIITKNPCTKVPKRKAAKGRNLAYTVDQQTMLIDFMKVKYPGLLAFCQLMYYTLMRTNEITHMQAWWIGTYDINKIYLPKEFSKNGQERHITIPPQLERIIQEQGWRNLPHDTYLFSSGYRPGKNLVQSKMHANKYRRWVLDKLKFAKDYTMYSWKHTGVVFLYRNNIPRAAIRAQAGFMDDKSFEAYLKSLALFENEILVTNYPSLPQ
jgi:integrase